MIVAGADDVAAEGDAIGLSTEIKAMNIAGNVCSIAGEQIDGVAFGTEGKSVRAGVELALVKDNEPSGRDDCVAGDAVLERGLEVVGQEPAANINGAGSGIVKFDCINHGQIGVG